MFRQSPSRSQRSKGIKLKSSLQICLLLVVCFWLIYQVKHSHDKKKEFDENNANISLKKQSGDVILNFGRKELNPRLEQTNSGIEKHKEEEKEKEEEEEDAGGEEESDKHEEEDAGGEEENNKHEDEDNGGEEENNKHEDDVDGGEEENKHEEDELEDDGKAEDKEDEEKGGEDDEVDEHETEKSDVDVDHEEAFVDDEEREMGKGKESEKEEDGDGKSEGESSSEDHNDDHNNDEGLRNTHEAREEHYKADDASSAVTHEAQTFTNVTEKGISGHPKEKTESEIIEHDNEVNTTEETVLGQNTTEVTVGDHGPAGNGTSYNATNNEENATKDIISSESEGTSGLNSTLTTGSKDQIEVSDKPRELSTEIHESSWQNGTGSISNSQDQFDSNSTFSMQIENAVQIMEKPLNASTVSEDVGQEQGASSNASTKAEDSNGSSEREENTDTNENANENEKSYGSNETDGSNDGSDSFQTENTDEAQHDDIDSSGSSNHLEEKDVRTDVETLPEIQTEGSSDEETVAER